MNQMPRVGRHNYNDRMRARQERLRRRMVSLTVLVAVVAAAVVSCTLLSGSSVTVGLCETSAPLTYMEGGKEPSGFEPEFAKLLADRLGRKAKFVLLEREALEGALEDGEVDFVLSVRQSVHDYMPEESFEESAPFIEYGTVLVTSPSEGDVDAAEWLDGKKVGVLAYSDAEQQCEAFLATESFDVRMYDIEAAPFQDMKLKKLDFAVADELYARYMQVQDKDAYAALGDAQYRRQFGLRLSPAIKAEAADAVVAALAEVMASQELKELHVKWFGRMMY